MDRRAASRKNKYFLVSRVIEPDPLQVRIDWIELKAVLLKTGARILWRKLQDETLWRWGL